MFNKIYQYRSFWLIITLTLVFTMNSFGQGDILKPAQKNNRQRAIALKQEGDALYSKKDWSGSIQKYRQSAEADSTYPDTFWAMGLSLSNMHQHKLAGQAMKLFLDRSTNIPFGFVWYRIGDQYRLAKEFSLSNSAFDSAINATPSDIRDLEAVSTIYSYRGNLAKSVEYQTRAINFRNDDSDLSGYISLSWNYSFLGQAQNAVNAATKAIQIDSSEPMAYTNRCRAYNDLRLPDKAIADCNRALSLLPNHGETQYYLANAYRLKGNLKEATRLNTLSIPNLTAELKRQIELESISLHDYCYILGNALFEAKEYEIAVKAYEAGIEFRSVFPQLRLNLGITYLKVGNKEGAWEQYRELQSRDAVRAGKLRQKINATR